MSVTLIERLRDEADLCRNDGADDIARLLDEAANALASRKPVGYHDKDQPNGIAWCPGFPEQLHDITPLYADAKNRRT